MGKKLKRYKQTKSASRMSKNELEVTVKGLAKSLNDYIREGNRYGISENFKNYLEKSDYKIKMKVDKKKKKKAECQPELPDLQKMNLLKKSGFTISF